MLAQKVRVNAFFESFNNPDGSLVGGYTSYGSPEEFRERFEKDAKSILRRLLEARRVILFRSGLPRISGFVHKQREGAS